MKIISIKYNYSGVSRFNDWQVNHVQLNDLNLIVGKNAAGKSRLVQLISSLSRMIAQKTANVFFGNWDIKFETKNKKTLNLSLIHI